MNHLAQFLAGAGSGLCGGLLSGLFGIGGGIVLVPLLGLALHLDQHRAQGMTLAALILPTGLPAVLHYRQAGVRVHWGLVALLILGFLVGVDLGARAANAIPPRPLRYGFCLFLLTMALRTWRNRHMDPGGEAPLPGWRRLLAPGFLIGLAAGLSSGLLGIGGGVVVIPCLMAFLGMGQRQALVTSLTLMLFPISLPGVLRYARDQGGLPWILLGGVVLGFAFGAWLGARGGTRIRGHRLQQAFALLLVVTAAALALRA